MSIFKSGSSNWIPRYNGLQIQNSSNAIPIPIVWGLNRIAPNILWVGGWRSYAQHSGGGKGGSSITGYDYQTDMVIGWCEGPIFSWGTFWNGNDIVPMDGNGLYFGSNFVGTRNGDGVTPASGSGIFGGSRNDYIWPNQGPLGSQGLYYPSTAYSCSSDVDLGTSATMPSLAAEIYGILVGTGGTSASETYPDGVQDADPAQIIYDFLTNPRYGVGFNPSSIDMMQLGGAGISYSATSYQTYCFAQGLRLSPALVDQEAANSILARWLQLTNSAAVWSSSTTGGLLRIIPYGDTTLTGQDNNFNSVTYTPNMTAVYAFGPDDFIADGDNDPVVCIRSNPYDAYNMQSVIALDRAYYYSATTIAAFDQNAIDQYGLRIGSGITANEICDLAVAQTSAQLILQRGLYIRNTYTFKLSFENCLLDPMDIVSITEPLLGLNNTPVRIATIEEDDDGLLSITAEECPQGVGTSSPYAIQSSSANISGSGKYSVPSPVNQPIIFEPPSSLTGGAAQVWAAVSGGVQPVYLLSEHTTSVPEAFLVTWLAPAGVTGDTAMFSVVVAQPATSARQYVSIIGYDGTNANQADFTLIGQGTSAAHAGTQYWSGISISAQTVAQTGSAAPITFYTLEVMLPIDHSSAYQAQFQLCLANALGVVSYTGGGSAGVLVWQPEVSITNDQSLGMLPYTAASVTSFASYTAQTGIITPAGEAGLGDPNWGGCNVFLSTDGTLYNQIGTIGSTSNMGVLYNAIGSTDSSVEVNMIESNGSVSPGSAADATGGYTLCFMGNGSGTFELFAYQGATVTPGSPASPPFTTSPPYTTLGSLNRGMYGTTASSFASGAPFARLDSNTFKYNLPSNAIGLTLYFKLQSFNNFGNCTQDISECAVFTYVPTGNGSVGPVASALILGLSLDYGSTSSAVTESDDWGTAPSSTTNNIIDLGTAP